MYERHRKLEETGAVLALADPGNYEYYTSVIKKPKRTFKNLVEELKPYLTQGEIRLYGKTIPMPRLTSFHHIDGEGVMYPYGKTDWHSQELTPGLEKIMEQLKTVGIKTNNVLVNI